MKGLTMQDVERLYVDSISVTAEHVDWTGEDEESGPGMAWDSWEAEEVQLEGDLGLGCSDCGADIEPIPNGWRHKRDEYADDEEIAEAVAADADHTAEPEEELRVDEDGDVYQVLVGQGHGEALDGTEHYIGEGPMMNYRYLLPDFDKDITEAAKALMNVSLCLVKDYRTDEYYLALTGGGMDFSWDICEAFIRLGYYPPLRFCDLPGEAGRKATEHTLAILRACERSAEITMGWAENTIKRLDGIRNDLAPVS